MNETIYDTTGVTPYLDYAIDQQSIDQNIATGEAIADYYAELYKPEPTLAEIKAEKLRLRQEEKSRKLRKDDKNYGNDSDFTRGLKELVNIFLDHDDQLTVNVDGKRYNTENKEFNDMNKYQLRDLWNSYENNPNGSRVLYYLRKKDGLNADGSQRYLYKAGLAKNSAYDRYIGQLKDSEWDLISEKRFDASDTFESKLHGSKAARDARAYDYGTTSYDDLTIQDALLHDRAFNDFGAGKSELYTSDILGLDTGSEQEYLENKLHSRQIAEEAWSKPYVKNDTFEFVDAGEAALQTMAGKLVKGIGQASQNLAGDYDVDGDGAIETYGKKLIEDANKDWGYNPRSLELATAQAKKGFREFSEKPLGSLFNIISGTLKSIPQGVAQSLPEIAMYSNPYTFTAMVSANINDELDTREENNGGRKATIGEIAAVGVGETIAALLDKGAFDIAIGKGLKGVLGISTRGSKKAIKYSDFVKQLTREQKHATAKALYKGLKRGSGAYATEATQEAVTEAIRMLTENLGTDKYSGQDASDILTSQEGTSRLATSFVQGGAGGLGFNAYHNVRTTSNDLKNARQSRLRQNKYEGLANTADNKQDALSDAEILKLDASVMQSDFETLADELSNIQNASSLDEIVSILSSSSLDSSMAASIDPILEQISSGQNVKIDDVKDKLSQMYNANLRTIADVGRLETLGSEQLIKVSDVLSDKIVEISDEELDKEYNAQVEAEQINHQKNIDNLVEEEKLELKKKLLEDDNNKIYELQSKISDIEKFLSSNKKVITENLSGKELEFAQKHNNKIEHKLSALAKSKNELAVAKEKLNELKSIVIAKEENIDLINESELLDIKNNRTISEFNDKKRNLETKKKRLEDLLLKHNSSVDSKNPTEKESIVKAKIVNEIRNVDIELENINISKPEIIESVETSKDKNNNQSVTDLAYINELKSLEDIVNNPNKLSDKDLATQKKIRSEAAERISESDENNVDKADIDSFNKADKAISAHNNVKPATNEQVKRYSELMELIRANDDKLKNDKKNSDNLSVKEKEKKDNYRKKRKTDKARKIVDDFIKKESKDAPPPKLFKPGPIRSLINKIRGKSSEGSKEEIADMITYVFKKMPIEALNVIKEDKYSNELTNALRDEEGTQVLTVKELRSAVDNAIKSKSAAKQIVQHGNYGTVKTKDGAETLAPNTGTELESIMQPVREASDRLFKDVDHSKKIKELESADEATKATKKHADELKELKDRSRSKEDMKEDADIVNEGKAQILSAIDTMTRSNFNKLQEDGQLEQQLGTTVMANDVGFFNNVKDAIKKRAKRDESVNSRMKFVTKIAKSNTAIFQADIDLAIQIAKKLHENGDISNSAFAALNIKFNELSKRSKKNQEVAKANIIKNKIDLANKILDDEQIKLFNGVDDAIKGQLLTASVMSGKTINEYSIESIKVDKDNVTFVREC